MYGEQYGEYTYRSSSGLGAIPSQVRFLWKLDSIPGREKWFNYEKCLAEEFIAIFACTHHNYLQFLP